MADNEMSKRFSDYIFWDVERDSIDFQAHAPFVIQRVLEYGQMRDWTALLDIYGLPKIVDVSKGLRTLDEKALSFISTVSRTSKSDFRCYSIKQSSPRHLPY